METSRPTLIYHIKNESQKGKHSTTSFFKKRNEREGYTKKEKYRLKLVNQLVTSNSTVDIAKKLFSSDQYVPTLSSVYICLNVF
jgi:hypothetical protein